MKTNLGYYGSLQNQLFDKVKLLFVVAAFIVALVFTIRQVFVFSSEFAELSQSQKADFKNKTQALVDEQE